MVISIFSPIKVLFKMKIFNLIIALVFLSSPLIANAKNPPPGSGQADVPTNILLVMDTSASMDDPSGQFRLFEQPFGVCIDSKNNTFVIEYLKSKILKFDEFGNLLKAWGTRGSGNGQFKQPWRCALDSQDNVYITDYENNRLQKFDNNGNFLRKYNGITLALSVDMDSSDNVYVSERDYNAEIKKFDTAGNLVRTWSSKQGCSWDCGAYDLEVYDSGSGEEIYSIAMWQSNAPVNRFSTDGTHRASISLGNRGYRTAGLVVNDNGIYTGHTFSHYIARHTLAGTFVKKSGTYGSGDAQFKYVWSIAADPSGNIHATDRENLRINKFDYQLNYMSDLGSKGASKLQDVKKVITEIVSSGELSASANFGLMTFNSTADLLVPVSEAGGALIKNIIGSVETPCETCPRETHIAKAMALAKSYLRGDDSPMIYSCQKTMVIVISDGEFNGVVQDGNDDAKDLYDDNLVPTLVISFHSGMKATHINLSLHGGTYTNDGIDNDTSPILSTSWQELYTAISDMVRQTVQTQQTFTKPVILPSVSDGSDYLFQSTFKYKNFNQTLQTCTTDGKNSESCQWEGHLAKYKLDNQGNVSSTPEWDAGTLLNAKSASDRNIYAAMEYFGAPTSVNNLSNFNTSNQEDIRLIIDESTGIISTVDEINTLINFVRGRDSYDEDNDGNTIEERWKLGDIYHSRLKVVGPPSYPTTVDTSKINTEAFYRGKYGYDAFKAGSTCGGVCENRKEVIYVGANDGMLHAFDSLSGEELWAFIPPAMVKKLTSLRSAKPNTTNSIYGVDGSIIVKDIYYDKGIGVGSQWYTVLIAGQGKGAKSYFALDITSPLSPEFLFAFENDTIDQKIFHWDGDGNMQIKNYSNITSALDYSKLGETWSIPTIVKMPNKSTGTDKWVAVFGAGYNSGIDSSFGSSIFVIDLEDSGKVLKRVDLTDIPGSTLSNSVPASVVSITADGTSKADYKGAMIYVADLESKVWKFNLTNKGNLYDFTALFDAEATIPNDRQEFFQLTPTIGTDNNVWSYYGTGNQQRVQTVRPEIQNRIFGIKDSNFPDYKNINVSNTASSSLIDVTLPNECPSDNDLGWFYSLGENERITGKIALSNEILYATRYKPISTAICEPGIATLSEHKNMCGSVDRKIELGEGIATGAVIFKDKIYIGVSGTGSAELVDEEGTVVGQKIENVIVIETKSRTPSSSISPVIKNESWREIF